MPITKELPHEKNGFKLIKDLGLYENGIRYVIASCKVCTNEFTTSLYHINKINSCGCVPARKAKELSDEINGFKIIKDLGYTNGSRRAICICKVCNKEYEVDPNKLKYRKNCGCIKNGSKVSDYAKSHKRLIGAYKHMMGRCYAKNNKDYYNYGKRGITVCEAWKGNPNAFCKWALENGFISVVPVQFDLTAHHVIQQLNTWNLK